MKTTDASHDKPRATIVYLSRSTEKDLALLIRSLRYLDKYFNDYCHYPVVVFNEDFTPELEERLKSTTRSELRFARLKFELPSFIDSREVPEKILGVFGVGYRHMCRFFAGRIFNHPALAEFDWYWRFDNDSFLRGRVKSDPFAFMAAHQKIYGYMTLKKDRPQVAVGLWKATLSYMDERGLNRSRMQLLEDGAGEWNYDVYYNNFEIVKLSFGRSQEYQQYFNYMDRLGGIYKYRWGDHAIRTMAIAMLVDPDQLHKFQTIPYSHGPYYTHFRHRIRDRIAKQLSKYIHGDRQPFAVYNKQ